MPGKDLNDAIRADIRKWKFETPPRSQMEIVAMVKERYHRCIDQSTVSRACSKKYSYLDDPSKVQPTNVRARQPQWPVLDQLTGEWVKQIEQNGDKLSGCDYVVKARDIWSKIKKPGDTDPMFSKGWFDRFQKRLRRDGNELAPGSAGKYLDQQMHALRATCRKYPEKDVFAMDETALLFDTPPRVTSDTKTSAEKTPASPRINLALCCNADGSQRLKIFVINTGEMDKIIPAMEPALAAEYQYPSVSTGGAWMTATAMGEWLGQFYAYIGKDRKVLLLVDNFLGHTKGVDLNPPPANIRIEFLPPHKTRKCSPFDVGIFQVMKAHYRQKLSDYFLSHWSTGGNFDPCDSVKVLSELSHVWKHQVKSSTITKCFHKSTLFQPTEEVSSISAPPGEDGPECIDGSRNTRITNESDGEPDIEIERIADDLRRKLQNESIAHCFDAKEYAEPKVERELAMDLEMAVTKAEADASIEGRIYEYYKGGENRENPQRNGHYEPTADCDDTESYSNTENFDDTEIFDSTENNILITSSQHSERTSAFASSMSAIDEMINEVSLKRQRAEEAIALLKRAKAVFG
ncbi:hypothetical protein JCM33374_g2259 [Metschnikowia sp. JCM 33374]|nr:hypothetical protein JCM33374_g2259 [Metschnikowia sp. JCM 33374]